MDHSRANPGGVASRLKQLVGCALAVILVLEPAVELQADEQDAEATPAAQPGPAGITGRAQGTTYHIKYWGDGTSTAEEVQRHVDALFDKIDRQMSTYRDDSELSRFNRAAANEWFAVSPETAYVVEQAIKYHRLTGGVLDVTVAPLLRLWHFGPGVKRQVRGIKPPTDAELHQVRQFIGAQRLRVRRDPPALWKGAAGVEVDLSSIAPGYTVDLAIALLQRLDFSNAMVEIGGEVRATGVRTDGSPWRIGIERADRVEAGFARIVPLTELACSTAGDYRNFRTEDGKRFTHIIDPRTGQALPYRGASVTVIADTCLASDALDTALLVMGPQAGRQWCVEHKVAALFQFPADAEGGNQENTKKPSLTTTPRFDELMAQPAGR